MTLPPSRPQPATPLSAPSRLAVALAFLHLGCTAYGGLAMLAPMRRRIVEQRQWLAEHDFLDGLALCQMLPGATVVQMATYVGYRLGRTPGALAEATGFVLPAFIMMLGLSALYCHYGTLQWVQAVSRGLNAMVIALLLQALIGFGRSLGREWRAWTLAGLTFLALTLKGPYLLVFLGAAGLRLLLAGGQEAAGGPPEAPGHGVPRPGVTRLVRQTVAVAAAAVLLSAGLGHWDPILGRMTAIFLKVVAISFGGCFVMIPILQWEVVHHWHWLTLSQFLDGILLSFVTPGPLIILAVFVGYWIKGLAGAALATGSVFLVPIALILMLLPFFQYLRGAGWMRPVLQGMVAALVCMLALVTAQMGAGALQGVPDLAILAGAALALMVFQWDLLWVALLVAGVSLLIY